MIKTGFFRVCKLKQAKSCARYIAIPKYIGTSTNEHSLPKVEEKTTVTVIDRKSEELDEPLKKKRTKEPFVKNLFLGKFDREVLTYPEVLDKERHDSLHQMVLPIETFFREKVDSTKIDREGVIPPEVLEGLKELGLYGLQVPEELGGLGLNATEYAKICEILSLDGSISITLAAHQNIGFKGILLNGTKEQKEKYLPRLASGELTAAFCLTEANAGSDATSIETTAAPAPDGKGYLINGSKLYITNGDSADVMTVFAQVTRRNRPDHRVTAFIVERAFGGVTSGRPEDKMGIRGSKTTTVTFENTYVPAENLLGSPGDGLDIARNVLNSGWLSMGSGCAGVLKDLLKTVVEHAVTRKQFRNTLCDFALIKEKVARIATNIYVMESMSYLTAGLIDTFEDQDCAVESAIVKIFSSEKIWEHSSDCLQILGGAGYMRGSPCERILRDCRIGQIFEGTNEIMRLLISLSGLQHCGLEQLKILAKLHTPMKNPKFVLKTAVAQAVKGFRSPKLDLLLYEYLHPSLRESADMLELCTKKLEVAVEELLQRDCETGRDVSLPINQLNQKRLAEAAIDMYAMTAVLGRASRSYCIGVHNNDHEMHMAHVFCYEASERVKQNLKFVSQGSFPHTDHHYFKISDRVFENEGYAAESPLIKTF